MQRKIAPQNPQIVEIVGLGSFLADIFRLYLNFEERKRRIKK